MTTDEKKCPVCGLNGPHDDKTACLAALREKVEAKRWQPYTREPEREDEYAVLNYQPMERRWLYSTDHYTPGRGWEIPGPIDYWTELPDELPPLPRVNVQLIVDQENDVLAFGLDYGRYGNYIARLKGHDAQVIDAMMQKVKEVMAGYRQIADTLLDRIVEQVSQECAVRDAPGVYTHSFISSRMDALEYLDEMGRMRSIGGERYVFVGG